MGRRAEAEAQLRAGLAIRQERADAGPAVPALRIRLAAEPPRPGQLAIGRGPAGGGRGRVPRGDRALAGTASARAMTLHAARAALAVCHYMVATLRERAGDRNGAIEAHREAARLDGDNVGFAILRTGPAAQRGRADTTKRSRHFAGPSPTAPATPAAPRGSPRPWSAPAARPKRSPLPRRHPRARSPRREPSRRRSSTETTWPRPGSPSVMATGPLRPWARRVTLTSGRSTIEESLVRDHPADMPPPSEARPPPCVAAPWRGATCGDPAGAAADVRRALGLYDGLPSRSGADWYETACCHAMLAGLAGRNGTGASADERSSEADTAMALLAQGGRDGIPERRRLPERVGA